MAHWNTSLSLWFSPWTIHLVVHTGHRFDLSFDPCLQEALHIGSAHNRSAVPFTASPASSSAPRVITNQYNNPAGLYSSENISSFNNALESKTAASGQETNSRA